MNRMSPADSMRERISVCPRIDGLVDILGILTICAL